MPCIAFLGIFEALNHLSTQPAALINHGQNSNARQLSDTTLQMSGETEGVLVEERGQQRTELTFNDLGWGGGAEKA